MNKIAILSFLEGNNNSISFDIKNIDTNNFLKNTFEILSSKNLSFFINSNFDNQIIIEIFSNIKKEITLSIQDKNKIEKAIFNNIIPMVGPDGVGKTTLLNTSKENNKLNLKLFRFKKSYRVSPFYHLFYPLFFIILKLKGRKNIDKLEIDEVFAPIIFFIALFMYPFRAIKYKLKKQNYISDRYFFDLFFNNILFNQENVHLRKSWKNYLVFTPKSDFIIQLDAPNDTILSRKKEMTAKGIEIFRDVFKIFLERKSSFYLYINTSNSIEECSLILSTCLKKANIY